MPYFFAGNDYFHVCFTITKTVMSYLQKTRELHALLDQGKDMEALDKFFHEDLVATEIPSGEKRKGLSSQKKAVEEFMQMAEQFHGGGTTAITANEEEGISMAETWMELTFKGAPNSTRMSEITVYRWEGDKIKSMDFYYHDAMMAAAQQP